MSLRTLHFTLGARGLKVRYPGVLFLGIPCLSLDLDLYLLTFIICIQDVGDKGGEIGERM